MTLDALKTQAYADASVKIVDQFNADPDRLARMSLDVAGIFVDVSKQSWSQAGFNTAIAAIEHSGIAAAREKMWTGKEINVSEGRAVLHVALRDSDAENLRLRGPEITSDVKTARDAMRAYADGIREGTITGATGKPFKTIIHIGIGGSDLGPRMVCRALQRYADGPRTHFVANVDGADLTEALHGLQPAGTLFIVASKTFTTLETMANAHAARRWLVAALGEAATRKHFVAVSTNDEEVEKFGIDTANMFGFWDWVGGRYSLWSAIGLPIVIGLGPQRFRELLDGAHAMDRHFRTAPLRHNLPVLMGLLAVWNNNFLHAPTHVCAPYAQDLEYFVAWQQQLEMESNGKSVDRDGRTVDYATTPAQWGNVGTNGQHAFFQMLHQGPAHHPVDFILPLRAAHDLPEQQRMLIANCLAQSAALMKGKTADEVRAELSAKGLGGAGLEAAIPHRVFSGGRPSNTILLPQLDARSLGALLALYEHRTFVQGVIWNINSFDQWGVELGKQLAQSVLKAMDGGDRSTLDASTQALLGRAVQPLQ